MPATCPSPGAGPPSASARSSVRVALAFAACVAVALALARGMALHFHGLEHQVLLGDELHALRVALLYDWSQIWTYYDVSDNSIPYTLWTKYLLDHAAYDELSARLPAIAADILLVASPLLFLRRVGLATALGAAALLATSPLVVFYSIVARPYAPAALCMTLALATWDAWHARPSAARLVGFAAAAVAAVFLHLTCLFPVAALCLVSLGEVRRGRIGLGAVLAAWLAIGAGLAALYGPGLAGLIELRVGKVGQGEPLLETLQWSYHTLTADLRLVAWLLPVLAVLGAVRLVRRNVRGDARLGAGLVAVVVAEVAGLCATRPIGEPNVFARYFFPVLPALLVLAAAGIEALAQAATQLARARSAPRASSLPASLALLAGAGLALYVPWASPLRIYHAGDTSLRTCAPFLLRVEDRAHPSRVVRALLADPEHGDVVLHFPELTDAGSWGDMERQGLDAIHVRTVSDRARWLRSCGMRARHVLDVNDPAELRASGAKYLLVDLRSADELLLRKLERAFGRPVLDKRYARFELGARTRI